jgi:hypothetical protein
VGDEVGEVDAQDGTTIVHVEMESHVHSPVGEIAEPFFPLFEIALEAAGLALHPGVQAQDAMIQGIVEELRQDQEQGALVMFQGGHLGEQGQDGGNDIDTA